MLAYPRTGFLTGMTRLPAFFCTSKQTMQLHVTVQGTNLPAMFAPVFTRFSTWLTRFAARDLTFVSTYENHTTFRIASLVYSALTTFPTIARTSMFAFQLGVARMATIFQQIIIVCFKTFQQTLA